MKSLITKPIILAGVAVVILAGAGALAYTKVYKPNNSATNSTNLTDVTKQTVTQTPSPTLTPSVAVTTTPIITPTNVATPTNTPTKTATPTKTPTPKPTTPPITNKTYSDSVFSFTYPSNYTVTKIPSNVAPDVYYVKVALDSSNYLMMEYSPYGMGGAGCIVPSADTAKFTIYNGKTVLKVKRSGYIDYLEFRQPTAEYPNGCQGAEYPATIPYSFFVKLYGSKNTSTFDTIVKSVRGK